VIYNAKYHTVLKLKETARKEMEKATMTIDDKERKIEEFDRKIITLDKKIEKQMKLMKNKLLGGAKHTESVEDIKKKISEVLNDIQDMIKFNSTLSVHNTDLYNDMERLRIKRLEARVLMETLKDQQIFINETEDKQLDEKIKLEQKLFHLKNNEA